MLEQNNNNICQKEEKEDQDKGQGEKPKEAADKGKLTFESSDYYSSGNEM